jgi:hypothetical protein
MLTLFEEEGGFKNKVTVIFIWILAIILSYLLVQYLRTTDFPMLYLALPIGLALFSIAGILLRCKFARWFTLLALYLLMLSPLIAYAILYLLSEDIYVNMPYLNHVGIFFGVGIFFIYILSNSESMDIYYINTNSEEHYLFLMLSSFIIAGYIYFFSAELLMKNSMMFGV